MGMKSSNVMGLAESVTLWIGDEEPCENKILMSKRILIQLQKPFSMLDVQLHIMTYSGKTVLGCHKLKTLTVGNSMS